MRQRIIAAVASLAAVGSAAAQARPYNNSSGNTNGDSWVGVDGALGLNEIGNMLGRLGTFVIGNNPNDPAVGPLLTGLLVMGVIVGTTGTNRAGVIGGSIMGVATAAVLSQSAGLAPNWVYGGAVFLVGLAGASVFMRIVN